MDKVKAFILGKYEAQTDQEALELFREFIRRAGPAPTCLDIAGCLHDFKPVTNVPYEYQRQRCDHCGQERVVMPENDEEDVPEMLQEI